MANIVLVIFSTRGDYVNEDGSKQKFTFSLSLVFILPYLLSLLRSSLWLVILSLVTFAF